MPPVDQPSLPIDHAAVVRRLSDPTMYGNPPGGVRRVETHISQVFITDRFVYKLKKPVRFDFLDFSTVEKREFACREEMRLNRRMAPDVYLGVVPLTASADGVLQFSGAGPTVDWVVKMRRLPDERMLNELIRRGRLTDVDRRQLAEYLGRYYAAAAPLVVRPDQFMDSLLQRVKENQQALLSTSAAEGGQVRRLHSFQLRLLRCRPQAFLDRLLDGRIIDGHGDLRPEHICLLEPPAVFDCLEFSAELRCVDVLDELCFLTMECDRLQADDVGEQVLRTYCTLAQDTLSASLIAFYKCYRACVRAKVAALRAEQTATAEHESQQLLQRQYLDLADRSVRSAGCRPLLIVVSGLMGTGKSTLARALGEELAIEVLRTDELREELLPKDHQTAAFGEGRYTPEAREHVYSELFRRADHRLAQGTSILLDGTFSQATVRQAARDCGRARDADVVEIECVCPREIALQRIRSRLGQAQADVSEARPELYDRQVAEREASAASASTVTIETTMPLHTQLANVFAALPAMA